jgi:hypothetical protein
LFVSKLKIIGLGWFMLAGGAACTPTEDQAYRPISPPPTPRSKEGPQDADPQKAPEGPSDQGAATATDQAPLFMTEPPATISLNEGEVLSLSVLAKGDGVLSYASQCANRCPASLTIGADGAVAWSPSFNDAGIYDVRFSATDGRGNVGTSQYVRIRVLNINRRPILSAVTVIPDNPDRPAFFICDVRASDLDNGDIVRISRRWTVNGQDPAGGHLGAKTVPLSSLGVAGDVIRCEATAADQSGGVSEMSPSAEVVIPNSPPVLISSGVVLESGVALRAVAETTAAQGFKVGDAVRCVVSLYDQEGGRVAVPTMRLVALPLPTPLGAVDPGLTAAPPTGDLPGTAAEGVTTLSGSDVVFSAAAPVEYFGLPLLATGGLYGISYSLESYTIEKKYAHRPLACIATVTDGSSTQAVANYVTRVGNTAPTLRSVSLVVDETAPNVVITADGAARATPRAGGGLRCLATYDDADGDPLVPSVRFTSRRGGVDRLRLSPSVTWSSGCVVPTGVCTATGFYTMRRWTDIAGDSAVKSQLSDIHDDVLSCATSVSDLTAYGSLTSSRQSAAVTVGDSPPTIQLITGAGAVVVGGFTANGSESQQLYTGDRFKPLTYLGSDPDGDALTFKQTSVAGEPDCAAYQVAVTMDETYYPSMVLSQVAGVPAMSYPHRDRSCKLSIAALAAPAVGAAALESSPRIVSLTIPNRAPKLFCGTRQEIEPLILGENMTALYQETPASNLRRYLKTASQDVFSQIAAVGQGLGTNELGQTDDAESDRTSMLCTVIDLDGRAAAGETPTISVFGIQAPAQDDAFGWTVTGASDHGCSFTLSDGNSRESLTLNPFGLTRPVHTRAAAFRMGVRPCSGVITVRDGRAIDTDALDSNAVSYTILPKINLAMTDVTLTPECRLTPRLEASVGDASSLQFRTPASTGIQPAGYAGEALTPEDFPASLKASVRSNDALFEFSDLRTRDNVAALGLSPVETQTFGEMMSAPTQASLTALSKPETTRTAAQAQSLYFLEDSLETSLSRKHLSLELTVTGSSRTTGVPQTSRTVKKAIGITSQEVTSADVGARPRRASFNAGVFGFDGMQVSRYLACPSDQTCAGQEASIASGEMHTCYVSEGGGVYCFGGNTRGQVGVINAVSASGAFQYQSPSVVSVRNTGENCGPGYRDSGLETCPMNGVDVPRVQAVTAGVAHSCALTIAGEVLCWGDNTMGQLGLAGNITAAPGSAQFSDPHEAADYVFYDRGGAPARLDHIVSIASGPWHTCALTESRELYCWGANPNGRNVLTSIPSTFCGPNGSSSCVRNPLPLPDLSGAVQVSAGGFGSRLPLQGRAPGASYIGGTTCALMTNGQTRCFGDGIYGISAAGGAPGISHAVGLLGRLASLIEDYVLNLVGRDSLAPRSADRAIVALTVGRLTACAVAMNRTVCWGGGEAGGVSDPFTSGGGLTAVGVATTDAAVTSPVVAGGEGGALVAARSQGIGFSCDVASDANHRAAVWCVGKNHFIAGVSEPTAMPVPTYGALGSGSLQSSVLRPDAAPVKSLVVCEAAGGCPLEDVVALSAGAFHACAVTNDGRVHCWGSNFAGQTGAPPESALSPQETPPATARLVATGAAVRRCGRVLKAFFQDR